MKKLLLAGVAAFGLSGCAMDPGDTNLASRPAPQATSSFEQGRADRMAWENWVYQQSGDFRAGASWWFGQRSLSEPGDCNSLNKAKEVAGCASARARLDPADRRRLADLDYRRGWISWQSLVAAYEPLGAPSTDRRTNNAGSGRSEIALHKNGGTFTVPVSINNAITLEFTIDSGATDVSIPADVVMTLMRTGTINRSDFQGSRTYVLADGSTSPSPIFRIRSLRVGNREATNVTASIAPTKGALLLGQSFLHQFGSWSIDNRGGVLVLD